MLHNIEIVDRVDEDGTRLCSDILVDCGILKQHYRC
jgi:hypothetical protein